jgi:hypothetical protein
LNPIVATVALASGESASGRELDVYDRIGIGGGLALSAAKLAKLSAGETAAVTVSTKSKDVQRVFAHLYSGGKVGHLGGEIASVQRLAAYEQELRRLGFSLVSNADKVLDKVTKGRGPARARTNVNLKVVYVRQAATEADLVHELGHAKFIKKQLADGKKLSDIVKLVQTEAGVFEQEMEAAEELFKQWNKWTKAEQADIIADIMTYAKTSDQQLELADLMVRYGITKG